MAGQFKALPDSARKLQFYFVFISSLLLTSWLNQKVSSLDTCTYQSLRSLSSFTFQSHRNFTTQADGQLKSVQDRIDFRLSLQFYHRKDQNFRLQSNGRREMFLMTLNPFFLFQ